MIDHVTFEKTTFAPLPFKFEAGTPDYIGSTALSEALRYVQQIGLDKIAAHERGLVAYAYAELRKIDGIRFYGEAVGKSSVMSAPSSTNLVLPSEPDTIVPNR